MLRELKGEGGCQWEIRKSKGTRVVLPVTQKKSLEVRTFFTQIVTFVQFDEYCCCEARLDFESKVIAICKV